MTIVDKINQIIINPIIILLFGLALLLFLWGVLRFITGMESDEARTTGRRHMIWGVIGMIIMFGVWAIIGVIRGTFGI